MDDKIKELIIRINESREGVFIDSIGNDRLTMVKSLYKGKQYVDISRRIFGITDKTLGEFKQFYSDLPFSIRKDSIDGTICISYFARIMSGLDMKWVIRKLLESYYLE